MPGRHLPGGDVFPTAQAGACGRSATGPVPQGCSAHSQDLRTRPYLEISLCRRNDENEVLLELGPHAHDLCPYIGEGGHRPACGEHTVGRVVGPPQALPAQDRGDPSEHLQGEQGPAGRDLRLQPPGPLGCLVTAAPEMTERLTRPAGGDPVSGKGVKSGRGTN